MVEIRRNESPWKSLYVLGGVAAVLSLIAVVVDMVIGSATGGNLSILPQTAVDRFSQFQENPWLGLYNLDLLNTVNQLVLIPVYVALYAAQRKTSQPYALLALSLFLTGTAIFVTTNTALPMLDLSRKYATATESQRSLFAAAGEALLARGTHGSLGVFIGFALPGLASLVMSGAMLSGKVFSQTTAYLGLFGNSLITLYVVLVTFVPSIKAMATTFALPGGLMLMAWMVLLTVRLFQLARSGLEA